MCGRQEASYLAQFGPYFIIITFRWFRTVRKQSVKISMASQRVSQSRVRPVDDVFEQGFDGTRCIDIWVDADDVLSARRAEDKLLLR